MNKHFENITVITKEEIVRFFKFGYYVLNLKSIAIISIFPLLLIFLGVKSLINSEDENILFLSIGIVLLALFIFAPFILKNKILKEAKNTIANLENKVEFYDEILEISNELSNSKIKYEDLFKIIETKKNIYLLLDRKQTIILNKNNFKLGSCEQCIEFLKDKLKEKYKIYSII